MTLKSGHARRNRKPLLYRVSRKGDLKKVVYFTPSTTNTRNLPRRGFLKGSGAQHVFAQPLV